MKFTTFLLLLFTFYSIKVTAQTCFPDENGKYLIYGNLKIASVPNDFNKNDLIKLLRESSYFNNNSIVNIANNISEVQKSFPTAANIFLQKSISIYSQSPDLEQELNQFLDVFNLVEKTCYPENPLLYEPNDLGSTTHRRAHLELINADKAWDLTKGDERIIIGITDTYIEETHEDLENKIAEVLQNGSSHFHGVGVAGCAAADTDNGIGIAAVGFNCKIAFSSNLFSDNEVLEMSQIPGVRVINMSWINRCFPTLTQEMVYDEIRNDNNVVLVAGAGNNPTHCGDNAYVYPAAYESVISVTSVGHLNDIGIGSGNWKDCHEEVIGDPSTTHHHNDKVNICAPGYNVLSTAIGGSYGGTWGTSFAAPIVAGACGLVASINPCLTATQIQEIVLSTADPNIYTIPENANYIGLLGTGRLDVFQAVKKALEIGDIYIQNQEYNTGPVEETALTNLMAGYDVTNTLPFGLVTVKTGSHVTFRATHKILLGEGFKVENKSYFKAEIYESNCF